MRFHASVLTSLAQRAFKKKLGMAKFGSQAVRAAVKLPVKNQTATGAMLDRDHHGVLEALCHSEPVLRQGNKICIVLDKNRNFKFCLKQFAKINVRALEYRAPVRKAAIRIDKARQSNSD